MVFKHEPLLLIILSFISDWMPVVLHLLWISTAAHIRVINKLDLHMLNIIWKPVSLIPFSKTPLEKQTDSIFHLPLRIVKLSPDFLRLFETGVMAFVLYHTNILCYCDISYLINVNTSFLHNRASRS